ncbi:MAG: hypothetical protein CND83_01605 [Rhodothermaeota bacterium MED-G19]|jgi:cell division protein FtsL|nr:MAG: hypothetical protein CND83_01605 [Rhodothermaeota bacterium MED-G19]|tara:strand:- start:392 stop:652 length:261 start_codon:yes stop_codon:yes gene_type:complete
MIMKNLLRYQYYLNFQNLTFFGLLILAYQNYETRNELNDINSKLEYSLFELDEIKKESAEANKYAKSANTMTFSIMSELNKDDDKE